MTKRIALSLIFVMGCAAESEGAGRDATASSSGNTSGAEVPKPPVVDVADEVPEEAPVLSWGFEPASADCNGWPVLGAEAIRAAPARSGTYSCKVCSDGSTAGLGLMREVGGVPAGRYVLTAWVRKRPQNAAPNEAVARIEAQTSTGAALSVVAPSVSVREEWDRLETEIDLDAGASVLRVTIGAASAETDHCLFIDDVTLVRQP